MKGKDIFILACLNTLAFSGQAFANEMSLPNEEFLVSDENFFDQMDAIVNQMNPEERQEFEQLSGEMANELEKIIEKEAAELGIPDDEYFNSEFIRLFEEDPICLAQDFNVEPGKQVSEASFGLPATGTLPRSSASKKPEKAKEDNKADGNGAAQTVDNPAAALNDPKQPTKEAANSSPKTTTDDVNQKPSANYGNWLKKLYYLREAQKVIGQASDVLEQLRKKHTDFYAKIRDEVDVAVGDFYQKVGVERGNFAGLCEYLETVVGEKINAISNIQRDDSAPDSDLDLLLYQIDERVDSLKIDLQAVKQDMESLVELDKTMFDRGEIIDNHIESAETSFASMEENLIKIDQTYNHIQAFELYGQIESNYDKIVAINKYLQDAASDSFSKMKEAILSNISKFQEKVGKMNDEAAKLLEKLEKTSFSNSKVKPTMPDVTADNPQQPSSIVKKPVPGFLTWLLSWFF
jgi:hypothetical protein